MSRTMSWARTGLMIAALAVTAVALSCGKASPPVGSAGDAASRVYVPPGQ